MKTFVRLRALLAAAALTLLASCGSIQPSDYAAETPQLKLRDYFDGRVEGWGLVQQRGGRVLKRFHVTLDCSWQGQTGTLKEYFRYSDGSTQQRVWTVREVAPGRYVGTAPDVVGEANGEEAGNALHWRYTLRLPVDGSEYEVDFDDWMFLMDDKVLLNRARMSKFGIDVGEITMSFRRS